MLASEKDTLYKVIGKNIARYIKELRGLTQTEFANSIGMNRATLSNIIAGRQQVSIHLLLDIAKELKIEPGVLFPTLEDLKSNTIDDKSQFNKILEQKGISKKSQTAILKLIEEKRGNKDD